MNGKFKRKELRHDNHTVSLLTDHLVFSPKYRGKMLVDDVAMICEGIICKTCVEMDIEIIEIAVNPDHVHIFFKYPPKHSLSYIAKRIKGSTSRILRKEFPHLKEWCDDHFWAPSCFHGFVGSGWDVVEKYIGAQESPCHHKSILYKIINYSTMKFLEEHRMSDEEYNIHDFDIALICEYFSSMDRQGPGSQEATIKALSFIDNIHEKSNIVDLGCGTGGQTIVLAQNTPGNITAIDLFPGFIDKLNDNAQKLNLQSRVKGVIGSMDKLDFQSNELDLIWSEGAIYNIGFEKGMNYWNRFLKKGGYVAVTEASWFTEERPKEIFDFWNEAYPEIDTIPNKIAQMQKAGYVVMASFILPETCWIDNFFIPEITAQKIFLDILKTS